MSAPWLQLKEGLAHLHRMEYIMQLENSRGKSSLGRKHAVDRLDGQGLLKPRNGVASIMMI